MYDPLSIPNNKFGIHVAELSDLKDAQALVNSNGGDWGYVTIVIQDGDKNKDKWQEVFNEMRRRHLIPIVRIATHPEGAAWKIPQKEDANRWADFLNSLVWPIENRYVVLFNEPNHAKEWGNSINPEEYADVALIYARTFRAKSSDFFILPAGLDMSAASDGNALEASEYIKKMFASTPEFFKVIDGWTSHSYPNPAFSGSPFATGKGTIASFQWEIQFLNSLGINKKLPIFITETGWIHNQAPYSRGILTPTTVGNNMVQAASGIWNDSRIVAITPFLLSYQGSPFDNFSWKKINSSEFYPQYDQYQKLIKTKGKPNQKESYAVKEPLFPDTLVTNSTYTLTSELTNTGQGILNAIDEYEIVIDGLPEGFTYLSEAVPTLELSEKGNVTVHIKTSTIEGTFPITVSIRKGQKKVLVEEKQIKLIPPPTISLNVQLGWTNPHDTEHGLVLIYDHTDTLLHKFQDCSVKRGTISVTGLYNMIPGKSYRIVVILPYYLPRQQVVILNEGKTTVFIKRLLPLDFNKDGALNLKDLPSLLFSKPNEVITRIF